MNKTKKITFLNFSPHECEAAAEYFESMAEKGWKLKAIAGAIVEFIKIEPQKIKYSVDVLHKISELDRSDSDTALEYREYCVAAGWEFVCAKGKIQVFCSEDESILPIHTDQKEKLRSVLMASLVSNVYQLILALCFILDIHVQLFNGEIDSTLTSNMSIVYLLFMSVFIIIFCTDCISFLFWIIKAKTSLKEYREISYNSYKSIRVKNIIKLSYLIIGVAGLLSAGTMNSNYFKGSYILYIFLSTLIPLAFIRLVRKFIDSKSYSKKVNMTISITSIVVATLLEFFIIGNTIVNNISMFIRNNHSNFDVNLTLADFGYKKDKDSDQFVMHNNSFFAERIKYSDDYNKQILDYTFFESKYPLLINIEKNRLIEERNTYILGDDIKEVSSKLPKNIKVYSDSNRMDFIIVSENKLVKISNGFNNFSSNEFLDVVYQKLFKS